MCLVYAVNYLEQSESIQSDSTLAKINSSLHNFFFYRENGSNSSKDFHLFC